MVTAATSDNKSKAKLVLHQGRDDGAYSDGDAEIQLLELFSENPLQTARIEQLLAEAPSWPLLYHLSPERLNLLNWYKFDPQSKLLEVGAGCGALTGLFCHKVSSVTAIELTNRRAQIIAKRYSNNSNLSVIAGNLLDLTLASDFDYVTSIGVLEYAGRFTPGPEPYQSFLKRLRGHLKTGGVLILAIENKFGLKYWAGASEDHTGRLFDSLENYPTQHDIRTFSRPELIELLSQAGFHSITFHYPLPDYKLPREIFSDEYLPSLDHNIQRGILPTPDLCRPREYLFNETLVMDNIIASNMFSFFANSFLVFAKC